jgi:hypothetical protein
MTIGLYFDWWAMGPGEVFKYILMAFNELGVNYKLNERGDVNWFVQRNRALDTEPITSFPNLFIGPNIVDIPPYCPALMDYNNYVTSIVPSPWVKELHNKWLPYEKVTVWNAGINYNRWCENKQNIEYEVMVYYKNRSKEELNTVTSFLESKNIKYIIVEYGTFNQDQFFDTISKSKTGILLDGTETQGIAIAEMMSCNLPLLVWDVKKTTDLFPPTSIPYFDETCGEVIYDGSELESTYDKFSKGTYQPREYILKNCNYITQAKKILELLGYEL